VKFSIANLVDQTPDHRIVKYLATVVAGSPQGELQRASAPTAIE
jgi:hypothetical protein